MSIYEDHFILCMMPKLIREMREEGKLGGDYSIPKNFKELKGKRKTIFKPVSDGR
jgi:hypothetical protein